MIEVKDQRTKNEICIDKLKEVEDNLIRVIKDTDEEFVSETAKLFKNVSKLRMKMEGNNYEFSYGAVQTG